MLTCHSCSEAALKEIHQLGEQNKKREERELAERRERIRRLPVMSEQDLVLYLRAELTPTDPEERGSREGEYIGAELARVAAKADLYQRQFLVREKAFLRPAQFEYGWPVAVFGGIESDADTYHRTRNRYLDGAGNLWEEISTNSGRTYTRTIEIVCPANSTLPPGTAGDIAHYWEFYGRRAKARGY